MPDFCILHYLLSSDSKAMAKVSKLHTSFFKTKKNKLVFYIIFVKGNTSRFGSAIQVLLSDMENISLIFYCYYCSCFLFLFLYCYGKMQFSIHCNIFCQKNISLLYFTLKSRHIPWWMYDGVYFKQSCTYQLIKNFIKNEHYSRSGARVLPLF